MSRLHGTFRTPAAMPDVGPDARVPWWDPAADASVSPDTDHVLVAGQKLSRGSRVRLRPGVRRADAQDMFLAGRAAIVEAVLLDEGVLERIPAGTTLIDMGSSEPLRTRALAERAGALGVELLDAPVSGGVRGALEGSLTIIVGGA